MASELDQAKSLVSTIQEELEDALCALGQETKKVERLVAKMKEFGIQSDLINETLISAEEEIGFNIKSVEQNSQDSPSSQQAEDVSYMKGSSGNLEPREAPPAKEIDVAGGVNLAATLAPALEEATIEEEIPAPVA